MEEKYLPCEVPGYLVSNKGNVKKATGKQMSTHVNVKGYVITQLTANGRRVVKFVHRLVAAAFLGDINGMEVNHKDFNKQNNTVENLEIVTHAENGAHYKGSHVAVMTGKKISKSKTKYATKEEKRKAQNKLARIRRRAKSNGEQGGSRPGAGRPPRSPDGAATRYTFWCSPENLEFLKSLAPGGRGALINRLLDGEREKQTER